VTDGRGAAFGGFILSLGIRQYIPLQSLPQCVNRVLIANKVHIPMLWPGLKEHESFINQTSPHLTAAAVSAVWTGIVGTNANHVLNVSLISGFSVLEEI